MSKLSESRAGTHSSAAFIDRRLGSATSGSLVRKLHGTHLVIRTPLAPPAFARLLTCNQTGMSGRISISLAGFAAISSAFRGLSHFDRAVTGTKLVRSASHSCWSDIDRAIRIVGSNPTLSATTLFSFVSDCSNLQANQRVARRRLLRLVPRCYP